MPFPETNVPTSRTYVPGTWAMQAFRAMDGTETRVLYGSKQLNSTLTLVYKNIPDGNARLYLDHFYEMKGTFQSFQFSVVDTKAKAGWGPDGTYLDPAQFDASVVWRYAEPPQLTNVRRGYSDVTVKLTGVSKS